MSRKHKGRQKKASKQAQASQANASKSTTGHAARPSLEARQKVRRQLVVMLIVLIGGGYGFPRWLLQFRGHFNPSPTESASALYERYRSKATWIKTIGELPGHKTAAADAMYRLRRKVIATYRQRIKQPGHDAQRERTYLLYVHPDRLRRNSRALSRLCQAPGHSSSLFSALLHPDLNLYWNEELSRYARMDAMSRGQLARVGWLGQRQRKDYKGKSFWTFGLEQTGVALIASGRPDQAAAFWRARSKARRRMHRPQLGYALCALHANMGRDKDAAKSSQTPRCRAIRAWALARRGETSKALQLLDIAPQTRLPVDDGGLSFLVRSVLLATVDRWNAVIAQWQQWHRASPTARSYLLGKADVFYLFNPIFTHRVPPALLATLQRLVTAQLQRAPQPALRKLLAWIVVRRGRQAILLGQPDAARAFLNRGLALAPGDTDIAVSLITLAGLWRGPKAALAALKQHRAAMTKHPKDRRRWAILQATYAAQRNDWKLVRQALFQAPCGKIDDEYQSTCRLLRAQLKRTQKQATGKPGPSTGADAASKRSKVQQDRLVRLLLTPARLRSSSRTRRTLRYDHPDMASPALRARLLLMQLLDPSGQLAASLIPSWHCKRLSILPVGHLLIHYLRRRQLRAQSDGSRPAMRSNEQLLRTLGRAYGSLAELWINHMAL